jgi:HlyD family secretion protein
MTPGRRRILLAGVVVAALLVWLILGRRTGAAESELSGSGTVEATQIEVGAQRQARLLRVAVKEGDRVKRGQLLAALDPGELEAQVEQARGAAAAVRAQLEEAEHGARPEQIEAAQGNLAAARANTAGAMRALTNAQEGYAHRTPLRQSRDAAATGLRTATAAVRQAEAALAGARRGLATTEEAYGKSLELRQARDQARQAAEAAEAGLEAAGAQVGAAEAGLAAARSEQVTAESDLKRAQAEAAGGAITAQQLDAARNRAEGAAARLRQAQQGLDQATAGRQQARATLEGARRTLANAQQIYEDRLVARGQLAAARTQVRVAEAQRASALAALAGARQTLQNARTALSDATAERQAVDTALQQYQAGLGQTQAAAAQLRQLRTGERPETIARLRHSLQQAGGALRLAEIALGQTRIVAPQDGTVTELVAQAGEIVTPGSTVVKLVKLQDAYVRIYLPLPTLGQVRLGQAARVRTDMPGDQMFSGRVTQISDTPEFTPKNVQTKDERVKLVYAVKIALDNPRGELKPGMIVDASLESGAPAARAQAAPGTQSMR